MHRLSVSNQTRPFGPRQEECPISYHGGSPSALKLPFFVLVQQLLLLIGKLAMSYDPSKAIASANVLRPLAMLSTSKATDRTPDRLYLGDCNPGELSHSLMWDAVSAWLAFRRSSSRRTPGGRPSACLRRLAASVVRRYSNVPICLK